MQKSLFSAYDNQKVCGRLASITSYVTNLSIFCKAFSAKDHLIHTFSNTSIFQSPISYQVWILDFPIHQKSNLISSKILQWKLENPKFSLLPKNLPIHPKISQFPIPSPKSNFQSPKIIKVLCRIGHYYLDNKMTYLKLSTFESFEIKFQVCKTTGLEH